MSDNIIVKCPHCELMIFVFINEFNCRIFRHGIYKHNMQQIDPHLPKIDWDTSSGVRAVKCDYI